MANSYFNRPTGFQDANNTLRPNGFHVSTGFESDDNQDTINKINNMKNKALEQIEEIDRHPYTIESMLKRKELSKIVKECDNALTIQSKPKKADRLQKVDLNNINSPDEFLEYLSSKNNTINNKERDLISIQKFINGKRNNSFTHFMYEEAIARNEVSPGIVQFSVDPSRSSDAFIISKAGKSPENEASVNYRITLRNGKDLNTSDVQAFLQAFQREAQERGIYVRCKVLFEQSDGIIFYVDKDNLLEITKLLEDLKDTNVYGSQVANAIKNFGNVQPFPATLDNASYYGIAMHGVEPQNPRIKTTRGGGLIDTFNGYMDRTLEKAYGVLLVKYGNDASKITEEELYNYIMMYHQRQMNTPEDIPLWMNNRIYNELSSRKISF